MILPLLLPQQTPLQQDKGQHQKENIMMIEPWTGQLEVRVMYAEAKRAGLDNQRAGRRKKATQQGGSGNIATDDCVEGTGGGDEKEKEYERESAIGSEARNLQQMDLGPDDNPLGSPRTPNISNDNL